jgi:hypothetical protein
MGRNNTQLVEKNTLWVEKRPERHGHNTISTRFAIKAANEIGKVVLSRSKKQAYIEETNIK